MKKLITGEENMTSSQLEAYTPPRMTDEQMKTLEILISLSQEATDFAKKVIIWTLRQTSNLTRRVALTLPPSFGPSLTKEMQDGAFHMLSFKGTTYLGFVLDVMGTKMTLQHHCGSVTTKPNAVDKNMDDRTIWFSYLQFDANSTMLPIPSMEEIEAIELFKL